MQRIAHDRIREDIHREGRAGVTDQGAHPATVILTGIATEEGSAHTARNAVKTGGFAVINQAFAGDGRRLY